MSVMTPQDHVGRRWLFLELLALRPTTCRVFSTEAACRYLYHCDITGDLVTVFTPALRKRQGVSLTDEVVIELLAGAMEHLKIAPADMAIPAQEWPGEVRRRVCKVAGLEVTEVERQQWWKAQEVVLWSYPRRQDA